MYPTARLLLCLLFPLLIPAACGGVDSGGRAEEPEEATGPVSPTPSAGETASPQPTLPKEYAPGNAVIEHLQAEGLPIGLYQSYDAEGAPFQAVGERHLYQGLAIFQDERVGEPVYIKEGQVLKFDESGGTVEVFANQQDLEMRIQQIEGVRQFANAQGADLAPEFQVQQGLVLLRLGHVMEEWVDEYEAALASYQP